MTGFRGKDGYPCDNIKTEREAIVDVSLLPAPLKGRMAARYKEFLSTCGLRDEGDADVIALMTDDDFNIVAAGARAGQTLKQFAVSPDFEGGGACATVLSSLRPKLISWLTPRALEREYPFATPSGFAKGRT